MNALAGMETAHVQHRVYLFDSFQLDVTRRKLLSSSGVVLPLNSRAMEALLLLVANAGEVMDRRRLMQAIWPHTIVEDNNLNQCILAIRKALGEVGGSNRFVMTVPGRGFCFVCPVQLRIQESAEDTTQRPTLHQAGWRGPAFWIGLACGAAFTALLLLVLR